MYLPRFSRPPVRHPRRAHPSRTVWLGLLARSLRKHRKVFNPLLRISRQVCTAQPVESRLPARLSLLRPLGQSVPSSPPRPKTLGPPHRVSQRGHTKLLLPSLRVLPKHPLRLDLQRPMSQRACSMLESRWSPPGHRWSIMRDTALRRLLLRLRSLLDQWPAPLKVRRRQSLLVPLLPWSQTLRPSTPWIRPRQSLEVTRGKQRCLITLMRTSSPKMLPRSSKRYVRGTTSFHFVRITNALLRTRPQRLFTGT